jgi:hypothetical protein
LIVVLHNYLEYKDRQRLIQNNIRYEKIRQNTNKEMKRYYYLLWPTCDPTHTAVQHVSDGDLIYNGGVDKENFLDVDGKSYCDTISYATCVEKNKWEFKTYIKCKNHTDDKFVDWGSFWE